MTTAIYWAMVLLNFWCRTMSFQPTIIERAFALASEGLSLEQIRKRLSKEHYYDVHGQLAGATIRKELARRRKVYLQKKLAGGPANDNG